MREQTSEKVGPTAWGIAYRRANCDIPFAQDILNELLVVMTPEEKTKMEALVSEKNQALTPYFEARYKLLNHLVRETGIKQIIELASGIASRGIEMSEDPEIEYVEMDLPGIIGQKKEIIDALVEQSKIVLSGNLQLVSGSALDDLSAASIHFDAHKPVVVIHEGLMRYLNFEQKAQVARHVKSLLEKFGGVYITPDITLAVRMDERMQNTVSTMVGMDINANAFENIEGAEKFFNDVGFTVEKHHFAEIRDELVSPRKLELSEEEVQKAIGENVFFVMKLK